VLVWEDAFGGTALDRLSWNALSEPRRDALSTPDAVTVRNGLLTITTWTGTEVEALYGYFEARIRFNTAPGNWCAFWLVADTVGTPLGDPGTAGVEIDVVEHRVTDQGGWDALRDMVALVQGEWHTYGVLWTETGYTFYVDEAPLWTTAAALSHRPEYLLLTCEVEDASWAGFVPPAGYGARTTSAARMEVDWVRAWQRLQ
jgi:beta-glucanase (GH16 family)